MAALTIAQLREKEVFKLARFSGGIDTGIEAEEEAIQAARRIMNSFYRLCGLSERNLYLQNDEKMCNTWTAKYYEEKESKWYARLDKEFSTRYGLRLVYCGYAPSIGIICNPGGGFSEKITRWFYQ